MRVRLDVGALARYLGHPDTFPTGPEESGDVVIPVLEISPFIANALPAAVIAAVQLPLEDVRQTADLYVPDPDNITHVQDVTTAAGNPVFGAALKTNNTGSGLPTSIDIVALMIIPSADVELRLTKVVTGFGGTQQGRNLADSTKFSLRSSLTTFESTAPVGTSMFESRLLAGARWDWGPPLPPIARMVAPADQNEIRVHLIAAAGSLRVRWWMMWRQLPA